MARLVNGDGPLLRRRHHLCLLLQSADDAVHGIEEILFLHTALAVARGDEGRLVAHVGDVGARETRSLPCQHLHVHVVRLLHGSQMHLEDSLAFVEVGQVHAYLPVEASGAQQSLVEHVGAVGGGEYDHAAVCAKAVHLGKQGVERALAFVVAAHVRALAAGAPHGVNLVDEYYAGSFLLGLAEEVAHAACPHADEHLHEVGTAHREEWHSRLASHGLGQKGLSRSRRSDEQCAGRYLSAQLGVFLGVLEEVHNLLYLLLCAFLARHVLEGYHLLRLLLVVDLCLALAHAEDSSSASPHAAHEEHPYREEYDDGPDGLKQHGEDIALVALIAEVALEGALGPGVVHVVLELVDAAVLHLHEGLHAHLLCSGVEHLPYVFGLDIHLEPPVVLVHHEALRVAVHEIRLELGVCGLLSGTAADGVAPHDIRHEESHDGKSVNPAEVELGLPVVVAEFSVVILVHIGLSVCMRLELPRSPV